MNLTNAKSLLAREYITGDALRLVLNLESQSQSETVSHYLAYLIGVLELTGRISPNVFRVEDPKLNAAKEGWKTTVSRTLDSVVLLPEEPRESQVEK